MEINSIVHSLNILSNICSTKIKYESELISLL